MVGTESIRGEPEALLAEAEREGRGRLKIYLGMAPGVGKTCAMLETAIRLRGQGVDVVAGVVETHGRTETARLVAALEVLPRRRIAYRGQTLLEFDIDAALARKPALLLVDELAHSNAPDSRHPKRWQDVEELLRAGIDVHSTLNVQHLESLSDVIARITGVRVAETLPDHVVDRADEIELVDLTPDELIARLREGKVYAPHLAGRARESFFKRGNLTALRELALRRAAESVDRELVGYMRAHAIEGPWPAGERILALVGPDGLGGAVVRAASRIADQLKAPLTAVTVERQGRAFGSVADDGIAEALALAERLGARVERLSGSDLVGDILAFAKRNNITQLFVGHAGTPWWRAVVRRSLLHELIRRADGLAVHVINEPRRRRLAPAVRWSITVAGIGPYLLGIGAVAAVVGVASVVGALAAGANVALLFLAAVLYSGFNHGVGPAVSTAIAAFLAYNFFFTLPRHSLQVAHWHDLIALGVFVVVALTTGALAARVRNQALAERARAAALRTLYEFAKRLGGKTTLDELLHAVVLQVHRLAGHPTMVLLPSGDDLAIRYAWPPEDRLSARDMAAARWAEAHGEPAGVGTGTLPSADWHFRPLRSGEEIRGVLGLRCAEIPRGDLLQTVDAVLDQGAAALDRIAFAADAARVQAMAETERLRGALLSSISHDLRTPLTAVLGAASTLRADGERLDPGERDALLSTIEDEAQRLDRFVRNLLDMTRLEAGALTAKLEWLDAHDAVEGALRRIARDLAGRPVVGAVAEDLPPILADPVLLETVLVNLLDNAVKHGGGQIEVSVAPVGDAVEIGVSDDGPGIEADAMTRIFDRFYRSAGTAAAGNGLGLSICRGLIEAMGGTIRAESPVRAGRGTRVRITLRGGRAPGEQKLEGP